MDQDGRQPTGPVTHQHKAAMKKLGFSFRIYDCRHTFASRALESGVDMVTLAALLGHNSLAMVMRYAHPSERFKTEAIARVSNAKAS